MFTTAVHSVRTKDEMTKIYNYLKNPKEILEQEKDNIEYYINVEKSRNSIKNYDIHNENLEKSFILDTSGYKELQGKETWLMDMLIENASSCIPCGYHVYQAFSKKSVTVDEAHKIGILFQKEMWSKNYNIFVFTHSNNDNIHNHILVLCDETTKFNEKNFYKKRESITEMVWNEIKK